MQAASQAAVRALILTNEGSHTQAKKLSAICSLWMSTPNQQAPENEKLYFLLLALYNHFPTAINIFLLYQLKSLCYRMYAKFKINN